MPAEHLVLVLSLHVVAVSLGMRQHVKRRPLLLLCLLFVARDVEDFEAPPDELNLRVVTFQGFVERSSPHRRHP